MPLSPGTRLGPYEIVAPLGAGGMGEVYRARDTRLGRDVAVKVLPQHLSASPEVRARFEREARTVSSLNHPHICTLHDIGREGDTDYLVMELVEGETLAQRLARGALPPEQVLKLGVEIADALDRAHRAGVVHRDLKPGNVMLTKSGAKLMDFGLARATGLAGPASGSGATIAALTQSPTMSQPLTAEGTIVGTFQYMAPEQLEGREADARTDLWAFGCVLYEMATGKRAFDGKSQASLISSIMKDEPRPIAELSPLTPPSLDRIVRQCLAKDPDDRWQDAGDLRRELAWIAGAGSSAGVPAPVAAQRRGRERIAWVAGAAGIALAAFGVWRGAARPASDPRLYAVLTHEAGGAIAPLPSVVAISPDGKRIAYGVLDSTAFQLWVRDLDAPSPRKVCDMMPVQDVFWSPDGRTLGFSTAGENARLWKVPAEGGTPVSICDVKWARGATWGKGGVIVFAPAPEGPLCRVSASGGDVAPVTALDSARHETGHRMPWFLPDGEHFLYASLPQGPRGWDIFVGSLRSKQAKKLLTAGSGVTFAPPGYLLYVRDAKLVAQRFDAAGLALVGEPFPIGDPPAPGQIDAAWVATASRDGRLAMLKNRARDTQVEWVGRGGETLGSLPLPPGRYTELAVSPDGESALVGREISAVNFEIWYADPARGTTTRVTPANGTNFSAVWLPDGVGFAYASSQEGGQRIFMGRIGDPGEPRLVPTSDAQFQVPTGVTPDGKTLVLSILDPVTQFDIWTVRADGSAKPQPAARTPAWDADGVVSPDGRWLAFVSRETGQGEVYVQPFPGPGPKTRVSNGGGGRAFWSKGGKELLYLRDEPGGASVMSAPIEAGASIRVGAPRALFHRAGLIASSATPDGERILISVETGVESPPAIALTLDWTAQMKGR